MRLTQSRRARIEKDGTINVGVDTVSNPVMLEQDQGVMTEIASLLADRIRENAIHGRIHARHARQGYAIRGRRHKDTADEGRYGHQKRNNPAAPSFLMWWQAQQIDCVLRYPPEPLLDWMCSGCMVLKPSQPVLEYYSSIVKRENSFDPMYLGHSLLNSANRRDGPIPWTNVYYKWTSTYQLTWGPSIRIILGKDWQRG